MGRDSLSIAVRNDGDVCRIRRTTPPRGKVENKDARQYTSPNVRVRRHRFGRTCLQDTHDLDHDEDKGASGT